MTPTPHPIDTDALRKRVTNEDLNGGYRLASLNDLAANVSGQEIKDLIDDLRDARDELDRLRAAEAAGKARVKELERALARQTENMAFVINNVDIARWGDKFLSELEQDREVLSAARAEIARLTDAGAEERPLEEWHIDAPDVLKKVREQTCVEIREAFAPPPPAAADRGVPKQPEWRVKPMVVESKCQQIRAIIQAGNDPMTDEMAWLDLEDARAALATAPKAEDVRREAIEECASAADKVRCRNRDKATYEQSQPWLARMTGAEEAVFAIRALADRAAS